MAMLADGTIRQTIDKQAGHGPYLWAVVWSNNLTGERNVSVFSFWDDAADMRDRLQANHHTASIESAVDNTRKTFTRRRHAT